MARDAHGTALVILAYNPGTSTRDRHLLRSTALSHAARVSHARKRIKAQRSDDTTTEDEPTPPHTSSHSRSGSLANRAFPLNHGFLQRGSYDPFDSTAIRIEPDTAHLMSTWREYLEINPNDSTRWLSIADIQRDFSLSLVSELNGKCLIFAASAALSARFPYHDGLRATASQSKRICLSHLHSMARSQVGLPATTELANCLLLIFIGLGVSDEITEARVYAGHLRKLLKHPDLWDKPTLIAIWSRLYYDDILFATRYFRHPLLESSPFVEKWSPVLEQLRVWESSRLPLPTKVTTPAFSETIQGLFSRLQRQIDIQSRNNLTSVTSEAFDQQQMTGSLAIIIEITYSLFSHWESSQTEIQRAGEGSHHRAKWQHEVTVTLCALAFLANMIAGPKTPDGPDFHECGWRAMQVLRRELEQLPILPSSHPSFWTYQHLQVWAYYLGATWECECNLSHHQASWYTAQLRFKVQELGIDSWTTLKGIADRFLRVPDMHKPGTVWFLGMSPLKRAAAAAVTAARAAAAATDGADGRQNTSSSARLANAIFGWSSSSQPRSWPF